MINLSSKVPNLSQKEKEMIEEYASLMNGKAFIDGRKAIVVTNCDDDGSQGNDIGFIQRKAGELLVVWKNKQVPEKRFVACSNEDSELLEEYAAMMGMVIDWTDSCMVDILTSVVHKFKSVHGRVMVAVPTGSGYNWIKLHKAHAMAMSLRDEMLNVKTKAIVGKQLLKCVVDVVKKLNE